MFVTKRQKAFMMFDLRRENKIIAFVKRNPGLVTLVVGLVIGGLVPDMCLAADDIFGLGKKLKDKINTIANIMNMVGGAGCVIGVAWLVISFLRGEFNYRFAGSLLAGGAMLAIASKIGEWVAK